MPNTRNTEPYCLPCDQLFQVGRDFKGHKNAHRWSLECCQFLSVEGKLRISSRLSEKLTHPHHSFILSVRVMAKSQGKQGQKSGVAWPPVTSDQWPSHPHILYLTGKNIC